MAKNFYLPPAVDSLSGIPSNRVELYKATVKQVQLNKKNSNIRYGMNFTTVDFEKLYHSDMETGKGFIIDTSIRYDSIDDDREALLSSDSVFSYKFGFRSDDPPTVQAKRCSCKCGKTVSPVPGGLCEHCNSVIAPVQKIRGWMVLDKFKVFNPSWLSRFFKYAKKNVLSEKEIHKDLYNHRPLDGVKRKSWNIFELQDRVTLAKFIETYSVPDMKDYFLSTINQAMTSYIPVLSKDFRHYQVVASISGKSDVRSHEMNKHYIIISDNVYKLNHMSEHAPPGKKAIYISNIAKNFDIIMNIILDEIGDGKDSLIRGKTVSKRMDNSCRCIIEGLTFNSRLDVCTIPYRIFGEITIGPFRSYYDRHGVTPEAINRMKNNIPNDDDCSIMCKVLIDLRKDKKNFILAYRPPCIYMLSQNSEEIIALTNDREQVLRFNAIKVDACDHGDFDGDTEGAFNIPEASILPTYFALNPKRGCYNPITGLYNSAFNLIEGPYLAVYRVLNVDDHVNDEDVMTEYEFNKLAM